MRTRPSPLTIAVAMILACGVFAATAAAVISTSQGKAQIGMENVGADNTTTTTSSSWYSLPGAQRTVVVPSGAVLINARFTAQSLCGQNTGVSAGVCTVRIVANASTELYPRNTNASGPFAFDSHAKGGKGGRESHAMERSIKLGPGTYVVKVQLKVTPGTMFSVGYWHLAVESSAV